MTDSVVDVVIPLHRADRDVDATIASAQSAIQGIPTKVFVVLHNLALDDEPRARLERGATLLSCDDGIPSPSGPRNTGLDAATAPYVFFLDSDDVLAPRCLRRLYDEATCSDTDVVLPSIRGRDGYLGTPLATRGSQGPLDVVRHHLFLRSHVPALLHRATLLEHGIRYPEGVRTGQDFVLMAQLYATGSTAIAFDAVYVMIEDGAERVSSTQLPVHEQLAAVRMVLTAPWTRELSPAERDALAHRVLSVNLAGGWRRKRRLGHRVSADDHRELRDLAMALGPGARRLLSVRDRVALRFHESPGRLARFLTSKPFGLVPSTPIGLLSPRGPLVTEARSWIVRHQPRRDVHPTARQDVD